MNPIRDAFTGLVAVWEINADHDYITCVRCRVCVPQGQVCSCPMRTLGPTTENQTRQIALNSEEI